MVIKNMKRLFLLAAMFVAAVVTSCDNKGPEDVDDGKVKMSTVSEDILTFVFWGGNHSSYYSIKNIPQDSVIVANSSAKWVNSFNVKNIGEVTYKIDPNDSGVERETTFTVSCHDAAVEYSVIQKAADVTCKAAYARCEYYADTTSERAFYSLTFSLNDLGYAYPEAKAAGDGNITYSLALYTKEFIYPGDPLKLPEGTYQLDPSNREEYPVIYKTNSACTMADGTNLTFGMAYLDVTKDGLVFRATTNDGRTHLATYYGDYEFVNMVQ